MTANQEEISNHETFQLEFDPKAAKWAIRTMQDKYFRSISTTSLPSKPKV